jgi:hypothetical protein
VTEAIETRTPDSRPTGGLSAQYQPGDVEQRRYERWVSEGYRFTADPASAKPAPEPVMAKIKDRLARAEADLARINAALRALRSS